MDFMNSVTRGSLAGLVFCMAHSMLIAEDSTPVLTVRGVEVIEQRLPHLVGGRLVRPARVPNEQTPLWLILSRDRYWVEDGHLGMVVELAPDEPFPGGELNVRVVAADGRVLGSASIAAPGPRFVFYPELPSPLGDGGSAQVEVEWLVDGEIRGEAAADFRVEQFGDPAPVNAGGRVSIHIPNPDHFDGIVLPFTVGVPMPRGALYDADNVRLVDGNGNEIPVQVMETARWSRFGSIKWMLCDFVMELNGGPMELFIEFGPAISRSGEAARWVKAQASGFPVVESGPLRFDDGLWWDAAGNGEFIRIFDRSAMSGGFVERADGRKYRMSDGAQWQLEEVGPRKAVVSRKGWYEDENGDPFCQYVTRWVIHRDSPLVRLFHSWIYTGNSDRPEDSIRNMGWRFGLVETGGQKCEFLSGFDADREWIEGAYLLQYDHSEFEVVDGDGKPVLAGQRAPGVVRLGDSSAPFFFGTADFWQNFPAEIEVTDSALWFHNWPRHNRPAATIYDKQAMSDSEWRLGIVQARFAHEGEVLSFQLPEVVATDQDVIRGGAGEHPNAQGISRTEEMWLYFPAAGEGSDAAAVLRGLDDRSLIAYADPAWLAASGALYEIWPEDRDGYPEYEETYWQVALAPERWAERLGIYGKWIWGDLPAWVPGLNDRRPDLYRAYRKSHHGWPYSWVPYARSGNNILRRNAEAATRQMIDANFSHYYTEENPTGGIGVWNVGPLPWASGGKPALHSIHNKVDYLWTAWYLTGFHRAKDNALMWQDAAKAAAPHMDSLGGGLGFRTPAALLKTYIETYESTFDPWFLVAAHAIAEGHRSRYTSAGWTGVGVYSGDREFLRFSGSDAHRELYLHYADNWGSPETAEWVQYSGLGWFSYGVPFIEANAYAFHLTGDERYLRRAAAFIDPSFTAVYEGDRPEYMKGYFLRGSTGTAAFTSYYLQQFPLALAAFEAAGEQPLPLLHTFDASLPLTVMIKAPADEPLVLSLNNVPAGRGRLWGDGEAAYVVTNTAGDEILSGSWEIQKQQGGHRVQGSSAEIPAVTGPEVYRVDFEPLPEPHWTRSVVLPITGDSIPEVVVAGEDGVMHGGRESSYWFLVPENVAHFTVKFQIGGNSWGVNSIWNPEGRRVWKVDARPGIDSEKGVAAIDVPPAQAGQLWRVVMAWGGRFEMDPQIPPYYSVTQEKWFAP